MTDNDNPREALDAAVRGYAELMVTDGEVITSWMVVAGTRTFDGGGVVISMPHDEAMPQYEARGLLATALRGVDRTEDVDQ